MVKKMSELQLLNEMEKNSEWLHTHFDGVQEKCEERFVAVFNEDVVADGKTAEQVFQKLEKKKIDPARTLIWWVPKKGQIIIL